MLTLSRKVAGSNQLPTAIIAERARKMEEAGLDLVNLTAGDPDFPAPRHIKEAAIIAIESNCNRYSPGQGMPELLQLIARKLSRENGIHVEPEQILVSNGAKQSVFNALQSVCNKGDEVVIIAPHCPDYPEMVRLVEATPVVVKSSIANGFIPHERAIRKAVTQKTKAILVNTPNNPSGAVYPRSLLEGIAAIAKEAGAFIISDELYEKVLYRDSQHFSIGALKSVRDQVITVNGFSMAYALAGWRIGYMAGPLPVIQSAIRLQSQTTAGVNSIAQHAAVASLKGSTTELDTMIEEFTIRRDLVADVLSSAGDLTFALPQGTFFVFFGIAKYLGRTYQGDILKNSMDIANLLLEHHHVIVSPGSAFGEDTCLRVSLAAKRSDLERGMSRLSTAFRALDRQK